MSNDDPAAPPADERAEDEEDEDPHIDRDDFAPVPDLRVTLHWALGWTSLVDLLTRFSAAACDADPASPRACRGQNCEYARGVAWSPATLDGVSCVVVDLDHVARSALDAAVSRVEFAWAGHSTHAHLAGGPDDGCYRLVVPLSRPATSDEFRRVRTAVVASLSAAVPGLSIDETEDISRPYYLPSARRSAERWGTHGDGEPFDVDLVLSQVPAPPADNIPHEQLARAKALRGEADRIEADAIRAALDECNWRVKPAAAELRVPYTSLIRLLSGRQKGIGVELEGKRDVLRGVRRRRAAK